MCSVNEWHALREASDEPCSVFQSALWWLKAAPKRGALLGVYIDLPVPKNTQGPWEGSDRKWAKLVGWTFLSQSAFPGLFDCFINAWEIRTTHLIWRRRRWHLTPVLLPGKSHGRRSLVGCSPWGWEESDTTEQLHFHFSLSCIGEGNGNPLQCSCLENPRDGGAWWSTVYGVAKSQTRLKWLSISSNLIWWIIDFQ